MQEGHSSALAVLFDRYHRVVLNIALRILRDANEAEDMVQSVFLEIFRTAAQFDVARSSAKVWILQYAYHRSFNRRRYLSLRGFYERLEEPVSTERRQIAPHGTALSALDSACLLYTSRCV